MGVPAEQFHHSNYLLLHTMEFVKWICSYFWLPDLDIKSSIDMQKLQRNLDSIKKELASMTASNQNKDQEVDRLTAELNAVRIELATCKGLLKNKPKITMRRWKI